MSNQVGRMPRTSFHGWLGSVDLEVVMNILRAWLPRDDFKVRDRLAGMEIVYDVEGVYLFCHEDLPARGPLPDYLMEGTIDAGPQAAAERLRPLLELCRIRQIEFGLEYVAIDENGKDVGEEISLQ